MGDEKSQVNRTRREKVDRSWDEESLAVDGVPGQKCKLTRKIRKSRQGEQREGE
ncbi:hypothetical protein RUM44_010095 [Polyplax serrata]|uniref:Uncharacterized protein n=1 Tax=Polyplax serrata TaxID=468196 RepID=A0ABR1AWC7_POLSC